MIFEGQSDESYALSDVLDFELKMKKFLSRPSVPRGLSAMATVRWRDQVILGGCNDQSVVLNSVIMYDCKSGKITLLPSMLENKSGSCAVLRGDTIVVLRGKVNKEEILDSVECLDEAPHGNTFWRFFYQR